VRSPSAALQMLRARQGRIGHGSRARQRRAHGAASPRGTRWTSPAHSSLARRDAN